jgi:type III pantothenate kinase
MVVADVGNTRIKVARVSGPFAVGEVLAFPANANALATLESELAVRGLIVPEARWHIASVNPRSSDLLCALLREHCAAGINRFHSTADLPRPPKSRPTGAGVDRALAVCAAVGSMSAGPRIIAMCGTAITVEAIGADGRWLGGAIAPGAILMAGALRSGTALLPLIRQVSDYQQPFGEDTERAISAGLAAFLVGGLTRLITLQRESLGVNAPVVWTGGDAAMLAPLVEGANAEIVPDLVLRGLAAQAYAPERRSDA